MVENKDKPKKPIVTREEKEGMVKRFTGMCNFMAIHGFTEEDKNAVNIRKLIDGVEVVE